MTHEPVILWFRRDLRLHDHPMLAAAQASGRRVVPLVILDPETEALGSAAKWRWGLAVATFQGALARQGLKLILRRGPALAVLLGLVAETGANAVMWTRLYDPAARARDGAVKLGLRDAGTETRSFAGFLLHEPWDVATGEGGFYKVFAPFWRAVRAKQVGTMLPAPTALRGPAVWPESDLVDNWMLGASMLRGAEVVRAYQGVGEAVALTRLGEFLEGRLSGYAERRDLLAEATSGLSDNLTYGEIGPRQVWHAGWQALQQGVAGAEAFLRQLVWRDFAWSLAYCSPHILTRNWRDGFEGFGWRGDNEDAERWRRGRTGEPVVDAAMREMYVTGRMHNRARMIVASYLTKHLLTDWRVGQAWFAECLTDWDEASNALGWQWVAGTGPDAAPFFRIFNPDLQAEKFDATGIYRHQWLSPEALGSRNFLLAAPRHWAITAQSLEPQSIIDLKTGRDRALQAWAQRKA